MNGYSIRGAEKNEELFRAESVEESEQNVAEHVTLHEQYESGMNEHTRESLQRANFIFTSVVDTMIDHRSCR